MSRATKEWLRQHEYAVAQNREIVIAEVVEWLLAGYAFLRASFGVPRFAEGTSVPPMAVVLLLEGNAKWELDGIYPPECDVLRSSVGSVRCNHERLVIATLATLLLDRGIRLDPRTNLYLQGSSVMFGPCGLSLPEYFSVSFAKLVTDCGWDEAVDYLAGQQETLMKQGRNAMLLDGGLSRLGPGRPKNAEYEELLREHFISSGNVKQTAKKVASILGKNPQSVERKIRRTSWFMQLQQVRSHVRSARSAADVNSVRPKENLSSKIARHLAVGGVTSKELANAIDIDLKRVEKCLRGDPSRYVYVPGNIWQLVE